MKSVGQIIQEHRIAKKMTQEELGGLVYVSKQAVSKWETGRTCPDIEMIRKLCDILDIGKDEILGGSVDEVKKGKKRIRIWCVLTVIGMMIAASSFFDVAGFIDRNTQSGVSYLEVYVDGQIVSTDQYQTDIYFDGRKIDGYDLKNAMKVYTSYGDICGVLCLEDGTEIEYGFINTNNWHHIRIRLDISCSADQLHVRQTISYETDNYRYSVFVKENTGASGEWISVYRSGV